jgi:hypothetical protein
MRVKLIFFVCVISAGMIQAQETGLAGIPSDNFIQYYLRGAGTYSALYSGKSETPYDKQFANNPYFESDTYILGTLCYNRVVYRDVMMRFDLFRNELTVYKPNKSGFTVLNNEKFEYAILNGTTIIMSAGEQDSKNKFLVLLQNGTYPIVRKYNVKKTEDTKSGWVIRSFSTQKQYAIYVNGVPHTVKNKNNVLKLFPDRRKELNEFAKLYKLNFKAQIEQSIMALVNHYESLIK